MQRKRQTGYSLIEMVTVVSLLCIVLVPLGAILYQLVWIPDEKSSTLTVIENVRQAVHWITDDARQATTFTVGAEPDYGTFSWVDHSSNPVTNYTVRYYYSGKNLRLMREETSNSNSETTVISDNVQNYGDISLEETGSLLLASITVTIDSPRHAITRTGSVRAQMRPVVSTNAPTPPPYPLAWDNFESGGWTGGTGWLEDWYHEGDASITSSSSPYEGTYHLQMRRANGYVDRALDLSGQSNVRLQFWAKADSFEAGETAQCLVSSDGISWHTVRTWVDGEDDNIYHYENIDLSSYTMTSEFWIAFDTEMSGTGDRLWIDDLKVVRTFETV